MVKFDIAPLLLAFGFLSLFFSVLAVSAGYKDTKNRNQPFSFERPPVPWGDICNISSSMALVFLMVMALLGVIYG